MQTERARGSKKRAMPRTYNGGSTVIGPGRKWSDHADFPVDEQLRWRRPAKLQKSLARGTRKVTQAELLQALGISRRAMRSRGRGLILKRLVVEVLLAADGNPNPNHQIVKNLVREMKRGPTT